MKQTGLTKKSGFQVGARRTFNIDHEKAWHFMVSGVGCQIWLGDLELKQMSPGDTYKLANGIEGEIRVFKDFSHIRLTWKPVEWQNPRRYNYV